MGIRTGMVGSCQIEGVALANDVEFSFGVIQATTERQGIGEVWATKHSVGKTWGGSVSGFYDPEDAALAALITAATSSTYDELHLTSLACYDNASANFAGSVIITSVTVTKSVGAVDKFSFDYEGVYAPAYT